jgi:hypothetical protein
VPISRCYLQQSLQLQDDEVARNSPMTLMPPAGGSWLALVGGKEGPEYHRQSTELARRWTSAGHPDARAQIVPGHDHFSIVMALGDPDDPLTQQIAQAMKRA